MAVVENDMVAMISSLTKDQLYDIMGRMNEEVLADLVWVAEVELMDRAYRKSLPALLKPAMVQNP